jgi:hypothetical protein
MRGDEVGAGKVASRYAARMPSGLDPAAAVSALVTDAKAALFEGDRQLTAWYPVRADGSIPWMHLREGGNDPTVRIVAANGATLFEGPAFHAPTPIGAGDTFHFGGIELTGG